MIDLTLLRSNPEIFKESAKKRNINCDIDHILQVDQKNRALKTSIENLRSQSNQIAKSMAQATPEKREELKEQGSALKKSIIKGEEELRVKEQEFYQLCYNIPNLLADDTPVGIDDSENTTLRQEGSPRVFGFKAKDHLTLAESLDLVDFQAGAKVAGSKFYFLKNEAVLLSMALSQFALSKAIAKGYTPLMTPDLAKSEIVLGAGYNPRRDDGESEIYSLADHDLCLIGTSEIPVGGLHCGEILAKDKLPLKYVAFSHCFRTEAGSSGKQSRGLYRVHQFDKVELFQITTEDQSDYALEELREIEESIFKELNIPYQVVNICSGDLGAPAFKKYDIEAWMPGKGDNGEYGEVTSCSNCTDFQARRLGIRYKDPTTKKNRIAHTLNGTGIAISRALVAIFENYQEANGSITIPKALRSYLGGLEQIKR